ncbi:unnamed protein product [Ectocarpus fasciculatus]
MPTAVGKMPQRLPKRVTPGCSFTNKAVCVVYTTLAIHATSGAASLAFLPPVTNRSLDYVYHHHRSTRNNNDVNSNAGPGGDHAGGGRHRLSLQLRHGRDLGSSLFSRLKAAASSSPSDGSFRKSGGCGGGGGGSSSEGGRGSEGGARTLKCSATAAPADISRERDPFVLEGVKNIRDLSSVEGYGIVAGRVFRTGHLSAATERDAKTLRDSTGLRTLVDLRSATELGHDELIHGDVYEGFVNVGGGDHSGTGVSEGPGWDEAIQEENNKALPVQSKIGGASIGAEGAEEGVVVEELNGGGSEKKRRYFVSLIDESIYKKGVFQRLRRRHKAAVLALAPATMVSRRCTQKARGIFLREINAGGLVLLNELLLQYSGDGIDRVLRLLASKEHHPVALYCTAGKDRTGLVIALTLAVLGVPDEAIVDDYAKSDTAYKQLADRDAMVGALAQQELDPDTFLGAPPHVMEGVLRFIRVKYGSIDLYLDSIGFDAEWRARLRSALLS